MSGLEGWELGGSRERFDYIGRDGTNREYTKDNGDPVASRDGSRKYGKTENKNKPCGITNIGVNSAFNI